MMAANRRVMGKSWLGEVWVRFWVVSMVNYVYLESYAIQPEMAFFFEVHKSCIL